MHEMNRWIIQRDKKLHGPFTTDQIKERTLNGSLRATDLISREGSNAWQPFGSVKGHFASSPATIASQPTPSRPPQSTPPAPLASAPSVNATAIHETTGTKTAGSLKKLFGGAGGLVTIVVIGWNIYSISHNGYLQTDAAAISLIEESMEETWSEADVPKPVEVSNIRLQGDGKYRTGTAVVHFGNEDPETFRFKAEIDRRFGGDLQVSWELIE